MVLIRGRKYACEACIRGHRAYSCSHTARQLHQVRSKGRPNTQCDTCKSKRMTGAFHGKCSCSAMEGPVSNKSSAMRCASTALLGEDMAKLSSIEEGVHAISNRKTQDGSLSLRSLVDRCQCNMTGFCLCCKTQVLRENLRPVLAQGTNSTPCYRDGQRMFSGFPPLSSYPLPQTDQIGKWYSTGGLEVKTPNGMTTEVVDANVSTLCQCGSRCSCPRCRREDTPLSREVRSSGDVEKCPGACFACSACMYGLTRPSGIGVIDEWMKRDEQVRKRSVADREAREDA